jgi:hypothetical protein
MHCCGSASFLCGSSGSSNREGDVGSSFFGVEIRIAVRVRIIFMRIQAD